MAPLGRSSFAGEQAEPRGELRTSCKRANKPGSGRGPGGEHRARAADGEGVGPRHERAEACAGTRGRAVIRHRNVVLR